MHNPTLFTKRCRRCGVEKPTTEEHFPRNKGKGFQRICLECHQGPVLVQQRISRRQRAVGVSAIQCRACGEVKPATPENFTIRKDATYGLARICRPCLAARARERKAQLTPLEKAAIAARPSSSLEWQRARKVRWIERNQERYRVSARAAASRRRARKIGAPGDYTPEDIHARYAAQGGRCWWCGTGLNGAYQIDHVVPLAKGGSNHADNLVCACAPCNRSKSDKLPHEWRGRLL